MSIEFPTSANTGDTVSSGGFTWIKEEDGQWTKILNTIAFTQSIISIVREPQVPIMIAAEFYLVQRATQVPVLTNIANDQYVLNYV